MAEHIVTKSEARKQIDAQPGDIITIELSENPTTGFQWAMDRFDDEIVSLERSEFTLPADARVGGGGTRQLTFRARQPGSTSILLKYWRSWEGDQSVAKRFEIQVRVGS